MLDKDKNIINQDFTYTVCMFKSKCKGYSVFNNHTTMKFGHELAVLKSEISCL